MNPQVTVEFGIDKDPYIYESKGQQTIRVKTPIQTSEEEALADPYPVWRLRFLTPDEDGSEATSWHLLKTEVSRNILGRVRGATTGRRDIIGNELALNDFVIAEAPRKKTVSLAVITKANTKQATLYDLSNANRYSEQLFHRYYTTLIRVELEFV